ncbi:hypothetical protein IJV57_03445 [Candidatus Saccharibacteria bacterium]|nr:hypothetical protein [Candidatus Saccharibacteria bacterium]
MATVLYFKAAIAKERKISYDPQVSPNSFRKVFFAAKMTGAFTATIKKPGEITITGFSGNQKAFDLLNQVKKIAGHN